MRKLLLCLLVACLLMTVACGKNNGSKPQEEQAQALLTAIQSISDDELEFMLRHSPVTPDAPHALVSPGREGAAGAQSGTVVHTADENDKEQMQILMESLKLVSVERKNQQPVAPGTAHPRLSIFAGAERQAMASFRVVRAGSQGWGRLEYDWQAEDEIWTASYSLDNAAFEKLYAALWTD